MNKSISFNLMDELDVKLLEHAEKLNSYGKKRNFSKYVKRLIEKDLHGHVISQSEPVENEKDDYTKEAMNGFL